MPAQALALLPRFRELRRICCRCGAHCEDDHICHDQIRHPGVERLFAALAALQQRPGRQQLIEAFRAWLEVPDPASFGDLVQTPDDLELAMEVFRVAAIWANLPPAEQRVANAILEHAGYPRLQVA